MYQNDPNKSLTIESKKISQEQILQLLQLKQLQEQSENMNS